MSLLSPCYYHKTKKKGFLGFTLL